MFSGGGLTLGGSLLEGDFSRWGGMRKFLAGGGGTSPHPPSRENPGVFYWICKKQARLGQFADLRGVLAKKREWCFWGGLILQCTIWGCNLNWYINWFWKHSMKNAWLLSINVFANVCMISLCKPSVATIKS